MEAGVMLWLVYIPADRRNDKEKPRLGQYFLGVSRISFQR